MQSKRYLCQHHGGIQRNDGVLGPVDQKVGGAGHVLGQRQHVRVLQQFKSTAAHIHIIYEIFHMYYVVRYISYLQLCKDLCV